MIQRIKPSRVLGDGGAGSPPLCHLTPVCARLSNKGMGTGLAANEGCSELVVAGILLQSKVRAARIRIQTNKMKEWLVL